MKIYTKTGDRGFTGLYGGERVPKSTARVQAYGAVDEANAVLGLATSQLEASTEEIRQELNGLQNTLFEVGADLATPQDSPYRKNITPISEQDVTRLEWLIDHYEETLPPLQSFILPGGTLAAASLHHARTVVRRAERECVGLEHRDPGSVNPQLIIYLNRLSDLLFVLARVVNHRVGTSETAWHARTSTRTGRG